MNVSISIDPASLEFANGDRYHEGRLLEALREFVEARLGTLANITTLQVGHRQGDSWAKIDGDSEAGEALVADFFEDHGADEDLFERPASYEVRMSDRVENTGLDCQRFASREEAQQAADMVNAEHAGAGAEVIEVAGEPTTTFAAWNEAD